MKARVTWANKQVLQPQQNCYIIGIDKRTDIAQTQLSN